MPEINAPAYLQGGSHTARNDRLVLGGLYGIGTSGGVIEGFDASPGSPGLAVELSAGLAIVPNPATWGGPYHVASDSDVTVTLSAADPANPRIDLIVAEVRDSAYSGVLDEWELVAIEGSPGASPVEPTLPDRTVIIARVDVQAGASGLSAGDISDRRELPTGVAGTGILSSFLPLDGGTLTGDLFTGGNRLVMQDGTIEQVALPPDETGAVPRSYIDERVPNTPVLLDLNLSADAGSIDVPLTPPAGTSLRSVQIDVAAKTTNAALPSIIGRLVEGGTADNDGDAYRGHTLIMDGAASPTAVDWGTNARLGSGGNGFFNLSLRLTFGGVFGNLHIHGYFASRTGNATGGATDNLSGTISGFYNGASNDHFRLIAAGENFVSGTRVFASGVAI